MAESVCFYLRCKILIAASVRAIYNGPTRTQQARKTRRRETARRYATFPESRTNGNRTRSRIIVREYGLIESDNTTNRVRLFPTP